MLGAELRNYAKAHAIYQQDPSRAPDDVKKLVLLTAAASARMRADGR